MTTTRARLTATIGLKWLLVLLAPALVVGIVTMHSLLVQSPHDSEQVITAGAAAFTHVEDAEHMPVATAESGMVGQPDGGEHGAELGTSDCSGLMAMCMALLGSFAGLFLLWRRGASRWMLWQRPRPSSLRLGHLRVAFEALSPLQRTTVLRC